MGSGERKQTRSPLEFSSKAEAREFVWNELVQQKVARFPFPTHGRIPNFAGAREAAKRLLAHPLFKKVRCVKVNPDTPQRYLREALLQRGVTVLVPTPRLTGIPAIDPAKIPADKYGEAAQLSTCARWAEEVPLKALPSIDLIVTGSVAVTRAGHRCGKGHGYGDLEYGILRELGQAPVPVVTTVHPLQVVAELPSDPHDLPVAIIATAEELIEVSRLPPAPSGIDWGRLSPKALDEMPVLRLLQAYRKEQERVGDK